MAKRFTDTGKWDKAWYRKLPCRMKCAWEYLRDKCDHAGIWQIDMESLCFFVGEEVTQAELQSHFKLKLVDGDKLFLASFIEFQYGVLHETNNAHKSVIQRLKKFGLYEDYISNFPAPDEPLGSPSAGAHELIISPWAGALDKEKEMDMDKETEKEKEAAFEKSFDLMDDETARVNAELIRSQIRLGIVPKFGVGDGK